MSKMTTTGKITGGGRVSRLVGPIALMASMFLASTGAFADTPADVYLYYNTYFKVPVGESGDQPIDRTIYNQPANWGLAGPGYNLMGSGSVTSGPVAFASVSSPGWTENSPGYNGLPMLGDMLTELSYDFQIVGPAAVTVPLVISGRIGLGFSGPPTAGSNATVQAWATDNYPYNSHRVSQDSISTVCSSSGDPAACNVGFALHINLVSGTATQVGQIGSVNLDAEASFYGTYFAATASYAFVDPLVSIDPTFMAANPGYSLVFAPGVLNAEAPLPVPEPATWGLMLLGLGAVGLRRRRD